MPAKTASGRRISASVAGHSGHRDRQPELEPARDFGRGATKKSAGLRRAESHAHWPLFNGTSRMIGGRSSGRLREGRSRGRLLASMRRTACESTLRSANDRGLQPRAENRLSCRMLCCESEPRHLLVSRLCMPCRGVVRLRLAFLLAVETLTSSRTQVTQLELRARSSWPLATAE